MILTRALKNTLILPRDLSGNVLWLDANDPAGNGIIPANSSALSSFVDKSVNGNTFSQATAGLKPLNVNAARNGRNAINFGSAATATYLDSGAFNPGASFTWIAAYQPNIATGSGQMFGVAANSTPAPYIGCVPTQTNFSVWNGSADRGFFAANTTAASNYVGVYTYNISTGLANLWLNGVSQGAAVSNTFYSASGSITRRIGCHPTALTAYYIGLFFEIACFNRVLATWEWQAIQSMMSQKWNIPVN